MNGLLIGTCCSCAFVEKGDKGDVGKTGADGKSAYELAVENGFDGTLEEWLDSLRQGNDPTEKGYVVVTDYLDINTGYDLSEQIQEIIDNNPNRTIYFPDGEYVIDYPISTSANPVHAVSLELSNFAVIKASQSWKSEEAMIRLGAAEHYNDINTNGSNYSLIGGIIDGNGTAKGVSIESGRETSVHNVSKSILQLDYTSRRA